MTEHSNINYVALLDRVRQRVLLAQQKAVYAANEELLRMYWDLGQMLHNAQQTEGWGKGTLNRLSADLKNEYPEEKGFSVRNLQCMIQFYQEYNQELTMVKSNAQLPVAQIDGTMQIVQPSVAQLPETLRSPSVYQTTSWVRRCLKICTRACRASKTSKLNLKTTIYSIMNKTIHTIWTTNYSLTERKR